MKIPTEETKCSLIAKTALEHYRDVLPKKGKPTPGKEWTVYAAIVATSQNHTNETDENNNDGKNDANKAHANAWVVSCATGTKCTAVNSAISSNFSKVEIPPCSIGTENSAIRNECITSCCQNQTKGLILHDSHAEILARRGLIRVLWDEIYHHLNELSSQKCSDGSNASVSQCNLKSQECRLLNRLVTITKGNELNEISFLLKEGIQLHLYISDNPCGDASIYELSPEYRSSEGGEDLQKGNGNNTNGNLNFTGAKIIMPLARNEAKRSNLDTAFKKADNFTLCSESANTNEASNTEQITVASTRIARERSQVTSAMRLKSGRSNLPSHLRSSSHSCSDKICKWIVLGIQGTSAISSFLAAPLYLRSIVVSRDERAAMDVEIHDSLNIKDIYQTQREALERALIVRAKQAKEVICKVYPKVSRDWKVANLPEIHICALIFPEGKSISEKYMHNTCKSNLIKKRKFEDGTPNGNTYETKQKKTRTLSPIGMSINWQIQSSNDLNVCKSGKNVELEQTVGAKGIKQGKKLKQVGDVKSCASRLSRHLLFEHSLNCMSLLDSLMMIPSRTDLQASNASSTDLLESTLTRQELFRQQLTCATKNKKNENSNIVGYQRMKEMFSDDELRRFKRVLFTDEESPLAGWMRTKDDHDFQYHAPHKCRKAP